MNRLKDLRQKRGLSQTELAAKIGVSQRHIAFIESGQRLPSLKSAHRMASVIGVSIDDIFFSRSNCT